MRTKLAINPITGELDLVSRVEYREIEVDFGSSPRFEQRFIVTDLFVTPTSIIIGNVANKVTSTGKDADEASMDEWHIGFTPDVGSIIIHLEALEGRVAGAFIINYTVA